MAKVNEIFFVVIPTNEIGYVISQNFSNRKAAEECAEDAKKYLPSYPDAVRIQCTRRGWDEIEVSDECVPALKEVDGRIMPWYCDEDEPDCFILSGQTLTPDPTVVEELEEERKFNEEIEARRKIEEEAEAQAAANGQKTVNIGPGINVQMGPGVQMMSGQQFMQQFSGLLSGGSSDDEDEDDDDDDRPQTSITAADIDAAEINAASIMDDDE